LFFDTVHEEAKIGRDLIAEHFVHVPELARPQPNAISSAAQPLAVQSPVSHPGFPVQYVVEFIVGQAWHVPGLVFEQPTRCCPVGQLLLASAVHETQFLTRPLNDTFL
jgi:hypothetical protein